MISRKDIRAGARPVACSQMGGPRAPSATRPRHPGPFPAVGTVRAPCAFRDARGLGGQLQLHQRAVRLLPLRAKGENGDGAELIEVKVESVRVASGSSVVYLRLCASPDLVLPVHIGEAESTALLKEVNKQKGIRPLTHDLTKTLIQAMGCRVTKVVITELVSSTYYSRVHLAREGSEEVSDVDARPSDAINLAVRFDAPMYISRHVAENATSWAATEALTHTHNESHTEIVRSVREVLSSFDDPTTLLQLQKEMAIQEERYSDAQMFQMQIYEHLTHSVLLRLVVAMEAALQDGRYEEAARVRDEYRRHIASQVTDSAKKASY